MKIEISKFGSTTPEEIDKFEKNYSLKLPEEYKNFLINNNGGIVTPNCFDFADKSDGSMIDYFFGINLKKNYHDLSYTINIFKDRVPHNLLPIACDPGGNLIVIGLFGKEQGKIYFWDHEFEADGYEPDMTNVHLISSSLDTFLAHLFEDEDVQ